MSHRYEGTPFEGQCVEPLIDPRERLNGFDDSKVHWPTDDQPSGNVVGFLFAVTAGASSATLFLFLIGWRLQ